MTARVLVVDDIAVNVRLLEAKLTAEYYDVLTASSGAEALKVVAASAPDIVLLDVMMQGLDGFEVCKRLKADPATAHIPVVMVTALSDARDRVRGLEAGADDFLTKPVNDVALFARIKSLVRLKRATDEWRTRAANLLDEAANQAVDNATIDPAECRILVVDEEKVAARIVSTLKDRGYRVDLAHTCARAFEMAQHGDYHVILTNDKVAGEDALRLCSQLRAQEKTRHGPILLGVAPGDNAKIAKALELGVNDYVLRPVDRDELIARVRTQVRQKLLDDRLRATYAQNLTAAVTDRLTGLNNRHYLESHFIAVSRRLDAAKKPISVLVLDLDRFKAVNDTYGHTAGDEVLKGLAHRILGNLRTMDTAVRYGGEEFLVLMPEATLADAAAAAERLRRAVADQPFAASVPEGKLAVTVSIGVATAIAGTMELQELVKTADEALYEAKRTGRNRVVTAGPNPLHEEAPPAQAATG